MNKAPFRMNVHFQKDLLPHLLGLGIFYLLILLYFSPLVFEGKVIYQGDILQWEGAAHEILDHREATGEQLLWTNSMFGGMPAYFVSLEFPGDITNLLIKVLTLGLPHPVSGLFFGMVGMYILLLSFRVRPLFAIPGGIAFAFNTFNLLSLEAGHNAKIWAVCLIPIILAGIHLAFERKRILGAALLALGLLLQLKFNHLQITYYTLLVSVIYVLVRLIFHWKKEGLAALGKSLAFLILGALLGVGGNVGRLATVLEYSPYSTRGQATLETESSGLDREYAFSWSNGKLETLTLLVPDFYGGGSQTPLPENSASEKALRSKGLDPSQIRGFVQAAPSYWGDQAFTGGPIYGGVILIFLALIGIWTAPKQSAYTFGAIILLSLMLSWGKNFAGFNYLLFDLLPGYNKFRAVSMALGLTLFAIPVLGMISLEKLVQYKSLKPIYLSLGIVGGVTLLLAVASGVLFRFEAPVDSNLPEWLANALQTDRKAMLSSSAWKSLGFILAGGILVFLRIKDRCSDLILGLGLALLITLDLFSVNRRYLNEDSFQSNPSRSFFAETGAEKEIAKDAGYFRVLNLTESLTQGARTSYRFASLGGYHGAKLRRYQDLIDYHLQDEIQGFVTKAQEGDFDWEGIPIINMLNTRYLLAGQDANGVFENPQANGAAWIPSEIIAVQSNEEEIQRIGELDTKAQATVNTERYGTVPAGSGEVFLTEQVPNGLQYRVKMTEGGLVVFSEIHYRAGWKATLNGEEIPILRTNYLLRGLDIPAGEHEVKFYFEPSSYHATKTPMILFQYLILVSLIAGIIDFSRKKSNFGHRMASYADYEIRKDQNGSPDLEDKKMK